jgi:hypothetical protein
VHYLDFKGRVTKLSMKNFQLVHWDHNSNQLGNDLVMQFGKRGHDEYALDFCYPLSLLQAFALGRWRLSAMHTSVPNQHAAMRRLRYAGQWYALLNEHTTWCSSLVQHSTS